MPSPRISGERAQGPTCGLAWVRGATNCPLPRPSQPKSDTSDFGRLDSDRTRVNPSSAASGEREGTERAFTEANLKTVLQSIWNAGGKPDMIMVGGFNKQAFSSFTGRATPIENVDSKKIVAAVDVYESDFGRLKVVPNRFQRARDVLVLQMEMWAIAYLNGRRMVSIPLARTGDSERRQMLSEYSLVARNEKSSGGVFDNTTS